LSHSVPVSDVHWKPAWRIIPTRYPEINLWKRVAHPGDEAAIREIEQLTNNRIRQQSGELHVLRPGDSFEETCPIDVRASFVYRGRQSRFSTPAFGAYYAAASLKTAVFEKAHRTITLLRDARIPSTRTEMRVIKAEIHAQVHDIRGGKKAYPGLYERSNYSASQTWATALWTSGSQGIVYDSMRDSEGYCIAIFSPQTITNCHKERVLTFEWDGSDSIYVGEVKEYLRFQES
jgi:hypothetical protein